jgi:excisionase family DNA binding protein
MAKKYLTLEEAAQRLGLSTDQLMRLRENGDIRGFADRGSWKFKEEEIEEFARRSEIDSSPDVQMSPGEDTVESSDAESLELEDADSDVQLDFDDAFFDDDDEEEEELAPTVADQGSDGASVEATSEGEPDLELSASDSDVRLAFDDSLFDSDTDLSVADSDVQLADDSAIELEDPGVLDFDAPADDGNSDSDVTLVTNDSDSDVTMVGQGTDADIELDSSVTDSASDSSVILTGSETDADVELSSSLFEDGDSDPDSDVLLVDSDSDIRLTDEPSNSQEVTGTDSDSDVQLSDGGITEDEESDAFLAALGLDDEDSAAVVPDPVSESDGGEAAADMIDDTGDLIDSFDDEEEQVPDALDVSGEGSPTPIKVEVETDDDAVLELSSDSELFIADSDSDVRLADADSEDSAADESEAELEVISEDIGDDDAVLELTSDSELFIADSDSDVRLADEAEDSAVLPDGLESETASDVIMIPDSAVADQGSGLFPEVDSDSEVHLVDVPGLTEDDSDSDVVISSALDVADSGVRLDDDAFDDAFDKNATVAMTLPDNSDVRLDEDTLDNAATMAMSLPEDSDLKLIDSASTASDSSEISLRFDESGITLEAEESAVSLEIDDSGISLEADDSGISLEMMDSGTALGGDDEITLDVADSGIALFDDDSGISLEGADDMGSTQPMTSSGGIADALGNSGADTLHMELRDDDAGQDSEFELAGLDDDDDDDFGTDTSVLMFDDGGDGGDGGDDDDDDDAFAAAALADDTNDTFADDDAFEDDLVEDMADDFEDDEMDDVWDAEEDDGDEGFDAGESQVGDVGASTAVAGVGTWSQDRPWGALWTTCVSVGALLSVLSAFVGIELVRTMWLWTQPGEPASGLLGMLGGMFGK